VEVSRKNIFLQKEEENRIFPRKKKNIFFHLFLSLSLITSSPSFYVLLDF